MVKLGEMTEDQLNISRIVYESDGTELEGLIFKPAGDGKFPGVVFIHGHGSNSWQSSLMGYFLAEAGFAAFLPTQLGYSPSRGTPDFCGPKTARGISEGIDIFLQKDFVDKDNVAIWGISRGATLAATLSITRPEIFRAAVFQSGAYEMRSNYETTKIQGIKDVIEQEIGTSDEAFLERSPIYQMDKLSCPVLILHGESDDRISVEQAKMLDKKLTELDKSHNTIILPDADHYITKATRSLYTFPFFSKELKKYSRS